VDDRIADCHRNTSPRRHGGDLGGRRRQAGWISRDRKRHPLGHLPMEE